MPHEADDARRNVLRGTLRGPRVERADVLRVAKGALERGGRDRNRLPAAFLRSALALGARSHGDLELRAAIRCIAGVGGPIENRVAQQLDELAVVDVMAELVAERRTHLAKPRVCFGR